MTQSENSQTPKRAFLINALDLLVLCCLAVAQPVFDLLGKNTEFLAARNSDAKDIILLTATLVFFIPALLAVLEIFAKLAGKRIYEYLHQLLLFVLILLLLLPSMKPFYNPLGNLWILIPLVLSGILTRAYLTLRPRGLALAYLSPGVLILSGLFLFHSPVRAIVLEERSSAKVYPAVQATAPVVMVVFDEFPLVSLLNDRGEINRLRYPNIAELSGTATWYRNATTIAPNTLNAVPAILDANLPDRDCTLLPLAKDHPNSLFALLGGSYRLNVVENYTHLCPEDLCGPGAARSSEFKSLHSLLSDIGVLFLYIQLPAGLTQSLPDITQSWKMFTVAEARNATQLENPDDFNRMTSFDDRPEAFARFVASIRPGTKPSLNFIHILLPHVPWEYLPSGKKHSLPEKNVRGLVGVNDEGIDTNLWSDDPWAILQAQKKHLLQVQFVDRLVGDLMRHLKETDLFDKSLIVITSDHGTSFHPDVSRRTPSRENYVDIMAVPLFIKSPFQKAGVISDAVIESIDILPTMADSLGIRLPWKTDGRSASDPHAPPKTKRIMVLGTGNRMVVDPDLSAVYKSVHEKTAVFGSTPEDLFRVGPYRELVGKNPGSLSVARSSVKCFLEGRTYYENVDLNSPFVLSNIKGVLETGKLQDTEEPLQLAVSINDTIAGVTQTYRDSKNKVRFSLVVSDRNLRQGANTVQIYLISPSAGGATLMETEDAGISVYRWGDPLTFGANGNAHIYRMRGWSNPEENITWTDERIAELVLPVRPARKPVRLKLFAGSYLKTGLLNRQRVKLSVNRQPVADWIVTSRDFAVYEATLPADKFRSTGSLTITLEMPDSIAPNDLGDGSDFRQLGLAVGWLSLSEIQQ